MIPLSEVGSNGGVKVNPSISSYSDLVNKAKNIKFSKMTWVMVIGAVVVMIVEKKMKLKPKKMNFNWGGKK